jgi:ribosomal protein S27E
MCGEDVAYRGAEALVGLLGAVPSPSVFERGMVLADGSRVDGLSQQPDIHVTLLNYGLSCPACRQAWSDGDIEAAGAGGHLECTGCRARYGLESPPAALRGLTERLRFVLRIDATLDSQGVRREGVTVDCGGCGAALVVDAATTQIQCRFCGRQNLLGASHGMKNGETGGRPTLFFICAWTPEEIRAQQLRIQEQRERARLTAHYDQHPDDALPDAANPATPLHVLGFLASHPDPRVRAAVAANEAVPVRLLAMFMNDRPQVAGALAMRRDVADDTLAWLCRRTDLIPYLSRNPVKGGYLARRFGSRLAARRATVAGWGFTAVLLFLSFAYGTRILWAVIQGSITFVAMIATGRSIKTVEVANQRWRPIVLAWLSIIAIVTGALLVSSGIYLRWIE